MPESAPSQDIDPNALREVADLAALAVGNGAEAEERLEEAREVVRLFGALVQLEPTANSGGTYRPRSRAAAASCRLRPDVPRPGFRDGTVTDLAPARANRLVRTPSVLTG